MKNKLISLICAVCMLIGCVAWLVSCDDAASEAVSVVGAQINDDGELILVYSDGSVHNLGLVVGKDGEDGKDGADGADGTDGKDGEDGKDGANGSSGSGSIVITGEGSTIPAASTKGLRSAVSIVCNFTRKVSSGWPNYGTRTEEYSAGGSGVIYQLDKGAGDAFIITNYHVVYDSDSLTANGISDDISVFVYGSEKEAQAIPATYVGGSLYYDIAVLRVDDSEIIRQSDVVEVEIANSDNVIVGGNAIAVGNAKGYGISVSVGVVSVDSEYITMAAADGVTIVTFRVMRVDTAINSGNSGGGLYDESGKLLGIVNAKIVDDGVENIGYAIPSNIAIAVADNIIDHCYETDVECVQRALLGVSVTTSDSRAVYDAENGRFVIEETVSVYEVTKGSLVDGVLEAGDIFVSASIGDSTVMITRQHHMIDMMINAL